MNCPCDRPGDAGPVIPAGLDDLPRQWSTFRELRLAMLDRARLKPALADWSARARDDHGVMWLELMAYVGELLSLYDKAIADESYPRTAKLRPSLRRLVELLGYLPRPAVAATVELAVRVGGAQPVVLPAGTGFRSGAFDGEPPQVFELIAPASVHPAMNQWPVETPAAAVLAGQVDELLLDPSGAKVAVGDVVLIEVGAHDGYVRTIAAVARRVDGAGRRVIAARLDRAIDLGAGTAVAAIRISKATRFAGLKPRLGSDPAPAFIHAGPPIIFEIGFRGTRLVLDGQYREISAGARLLVSRAGETRWLTVSEREDVARTIIEGHGNGTITLEMPNADDVVVRPPATPAVTAHFTRIAAVASLNWVKATPSSPTWTGSTPADYTVGFALIAAGRVLGPAVRAIVPGDPLIVKGARPPVGSTASTARVVLRDAEARAVAIAAGVELATGVITPGPGATWSPPLATPLTAYGNLVTAVRGETVTGEALGTGDATVEHQRFELAKKPLTYRAAPTESGVASSLQVWVDGLAWTEVAGFFGARPDDPIYVVRHDDDGGSAVTFGDGVRGARVPTGAAVVASYRHGAGAKSPPAGSVTQVARPVPGLDAVAAALAAGGGADAEDREALRELAPRSALLLGRAISIADMEVAARLVPGVIAAQADWAWDGERQRPVVKVWIIGTEAVARSVGDRLRALADPDTPIGCGPAAPITATAAIDLEIDRRRIVADVVAAATAMLIAEGGLLTPGRLGVAGPVLRSPLLAALLDLPGVSGVRGLAWNGAALLDYGVAPGAGHYFDVAAGLTVTGSY